MIKITVEYWQHLKKENIQCSHRFSLLRLFIVRSLRRLTKVIKYRLKSKSYQLVEKIEDLDCDTTLVSIISQRENAINKPSLFIPNSQILDTFKRLQGISPEVKVAVLTNCLAFSKSSSIGDNNQIYNHAINNMSPSHDLKNLSTHSINSFKSKKITISFKPHIEGENIPFYIHLLHEHSKNYYHWLYEIMPKFIQICDIINKTENLKNQKYILLLDYNLPKQFYEILKLYSTIQYDMKILNRFEAFFCPKMIFCTDFWTSLDNTRFQPNILKEFFVDSFSVSLVKEKLSKNLFSTVVPIKKVYLERQTTQARSLNNALEVRDFLQQEGFDIINPSLLTFEEQIRLFSEVKIIIGTSGAAFSNIIFMQPKTYAVIFSPSTIGSNYYIFQPMADVAHITLTHILTESRSANQSVHASASVDIEHIKSFLKTIQ